MSGSTSTFKPTAAQPSDLEVADIGFAPVNFKFESFAQNPAYDWTKRAAVRDMSDWPLIEPRSAPKVGKKLPLLIERMIESTWQFAEPADMKARGSSLVIGQRGQSKVELQQRRTYREQVRPTRDGEIGGPGLTVKTPSKTAIASDWKVFEQLDRKNAVTFRGDTRKPWDVIFKGDGFHPPNSRTDEAYIDNIYAEFESYLQRRYGRRLTKEAFMKAFNKEAAMPQEQRTLTDYLMWRKIVEREAVHLGRMVENECLKGYISTSRSIDRACYFGTNYWKKPGWLYITVVHDGFVVPNGLSETWGTTEGEVAQWGPIPAKRIVGFMRLESGGQPTGPIYARRRFRSDEPKAFAAVFDIMSGKGP